MEHELDYLESRVAALIGRIHELDAQNSRLASALGEALRDNAELKFALEETRRRVGVLIDRLPKEEEA
ncbi:hypothetical protein ACFOKJ_06845 [Vogesella amnigena]|uniref:Cell division protein ZapB n=1 Tax=Vogesella amnigena TaxID=1507449 RepID=A0ABV7TSZ5_9NEIS